MALVRDVVLVAVFGFVALTVGVQVMAHRRAGKLKGQPLPSLPGALGQRITASPRSLIYFYTPQCGACRAITPRMKALAGEGKPVFPVDASQDPGIAMALSVMATPTTVEVVDGNVVGVHLGPVSPEVWARFA
jgi:thioredoxin 1